MGLCVVVDIARAFIFVFDALMPMCVCTRTRAVPLKEVGELGRRGRRGKKKQNSYKVYGIFDQVIPQALFSTHLHSGLQATTPTHTFLPLHSFPHPHNDCRFSPPLSSALVRLNALEKCHGTSLGLAPGEEKRKRGKRRRKKKMGNEYAKEGNRVKYAVLYQATSSHEPESTITPPPSKASINRQHEASQGCVM